DVSGRVTDRDVYARSRRILAKLREPPEPEALVRDDDRRVRVFEHERELVARQVPVHRHDAKPGRYRRDEDRKVFRAVRRDDRDDVARSHAACEQAVGNAARDGRKPASRPAVAARADDGERVRITRDEALERKPAHEQTSAPARTAARGVPRGRLRAVLATRLKALAPSIRPGSPVGE